MVDWYIIGKEGDYYFWEGADDNGDYVYQATKTAEPPEGESGYYNLSSLLKMKGVTPSTPSSGR